MSKRNELELSDAAKAFAKSSAVPDEVREYMARKHENGVARFEYFRYAAALARAEAEAILNVRQVNALKGDEPTDSDWRRAAIEADSTIKSLSQENDALRSELTRALAGPSMAVHSED